MMIALIGLNANAAMYLVGNEPLGQGWDPSKGIEMTDNNDGTYTYDVVIDGETWFCFADGLTTGNSNSDWDVFNGQYRYGPTGGVNQTVEAAAWVTTQRQGNGNGSYYFRGTGDKYTVTFDKTNMKFKIDGYVEPIVYESFTVAGNNADIFGEAWNVTLTQNDMTLDETDGLYKLVKENVEITGAPYTLYYKVAANHAWGESWGNPSGPDGNQDYVFNENGTYNLTFKFNFETKEVTLDVVPVQAGEDTEVYIFGDLNDYAWNPTLGLQMTLNEGIYSAEVTTTLREGNELAYIGFTKKLAETNDDAAWDAIAPYRFGPVSEGAFVMTEELLGTECDLATNGSYESIALPVGTWTVTVDLVNNKFTVNGEWPTDTIVPEPETEVYIIGDVNNIGWSATQGVQMTLNEGVYTAEITTQNQGDLGIGYFGFTKKLADPESQSENIWDDIAAYRFGPVSEGAFVMTEELLNQSIELDLEGSYESVAIPEGTWTVSVDLTNGILKINGTWPTDTVIPEPAADVYILGEVNGNSWAPNNGVKMTLNEGVYTANITTAGENDGLSYFSFTKQLAEGDAQEDWDAIAPYRFGAVSEDDFIMTEELLGQECALATDGSYNAIAIPAGEWTVTVDLENNIFTINGTWPTDTVIPEPTTDVYIIGEVNGNIWATNVGVKMTLNEGIYTANITTDGQSGGLSYFSFTKQLADSAADWEAIAPYRFGPVSDGDFIMTEELLGQECALTTDGSNAIAIPAGEWTVTVDLENLIFTINGEWPETPTPEPYDGDVYIMGEVNDNGGWFTNKGVKMTRDAENNVYTATITTAGENEGYSYFSFTKQLAEGEADWEAIAPYRFGAVSEGDFLVTEELLGQELALENAGDAYKIEAGTWNLTLSVDNMTLKIEKAEEPAVLRGDVDQNGTVAIADVTTLIDLLLKNGETPAEADTNLDTVVTIGDVTVLIDYLLSGNWPAAE